MTTILNRIGLRGIALAALSCSLFIGAAYMVLMSRQIEEPLRGFPWCSQDDRANVSLAIIMPVNGKTDLNFYNNMWVGEYLHTVCDFGGPECTMACNAKSTYGTLDKKTICFTNIIKEKYTDTEFFIKLDDDAFVDRNYVLGLVKKYKGYEKPVYISDFILNLDNANLSLNHTYYGNGKFYMFNRALLNCIDTEIQYKGKRNEDAIFGAMVHNGCGPDVLKVLEDDSKIYHKTYRNKNKNIDLAALFNH